MTLFSFPFPQFLGVLRPAKSLLGFNYFRFFINDSCVICLLLVWTVVANFLHNFHCFLMNLCSCWVSLSLFINGLFVTKWFVSSRRLCLIARKVFNGICLVVNNIVFYGLCILVKGLYFIVEVDPVLCNSCNSCRKNLNSNNKIYSIKKII